MTASSAAAKPAVLMLLTSDFVAARHRALCEMAPELDVVTSVDECDPARIDAIFGFKLPAGVAPRLPNLKLVASIGAGADGLMGAGDIPAGVAITRVVEKSLGLSMAQYVSYHVARRFRSFETYEAQQRGRIWARQPIPDARDHTVAIMGLGEIGRTVALALAAQGYRVLGWNQSGGAAEGVERIYRGAGELAAFLGQADTLVCLLPFTAGTRGLLDAKLLSQLKRGAYLVNVARGGIVVERELLALIDGGQLSGAALDVFETEPLPQDDPLWSHPKITLTPHVAAHPSVEPAVEQFIENLRRVRAGEPPLHTIDRAAGY